MGKHLCDALRIQISLTDKDVLSPLLFKFALECALGESKKF